MRLVGNCQTQRRGVAQLVARSVRDAEVVGSNPVASTKQLLQPVGGKSCFFVPKPRRESMDEMSECKENRALREKSHFAFIDYTLHKKNNSTGVELFYVSYALSKARAPISLTMSFAMFLSQ